MEVVASGGTLDAKAKSNVKYTAQMTLSTATPAAKTDGETPRASETATKLTARIKKKKKEDATELVDLRSPKCGIFTASQVNEYNRTQSDKCSNQIQHISDLKFQSIPVSNKSLKSVSVNLSDSRNVLYRFSGKNDVNRTKFRDV